MESLVGTALGGYKLTSLLGSGPTGQTYAALDSVSAPIAIKVIHSGLSLFTRAEAFWAELRKVGELAHPHITVAASADWSKSGRFFVSLDLLDGISLEDALRQQVRLPAAQVLLLAGQVCLALEAAHEAGLVHGAVKPRNIFLVPRGSQPDAFSTRLLDFGTGRLLGATQASGTGGSPGVPEPAYLSPEQLKGQSSPASDLHALGVVIYEAISGRRPFAGGVAEIAAAQARPLEMPESIPAGLSDLLRRALARTPAERFASASALREALEAWAAAAPPALEEPGLALFAKNSEDVGVGQQEAEQTVKVALDELSGAVLDRDQDEPLLERPPQPAEPPAPSPARQVSHKPAVAGEAAAANITKGLSMPDVKNPSKPVPADQELAAIAEKAASPLRSKPESAAAATAATPPAPAARPQETEAYFDEDDELVELPLEKSVRAFVSNLLPVSPPPRKVARANGNGESLEAALDQFVQEARHISAALPPPLVDDRRLAQLAKALVIEEPAPVKPAPPPVVSAPVVTTGGKRGVLLPSLISFLLGGVIVFGAYKLFLEKPTTESTSSSEGSAVGSGEPVSGAGSAEGTAEPAAGSSAAVPATAPDQGTGATASATPDSSTPEADAAAAAAAAGSPDAAPALATPKVEPKAKKKVAKKIRVAPKKKEGAVVRPEKKEKKGKKGGGSDWVDPFSQ